MKRVFFVAAVVAVSVLSGCFYARAVKARQGVMEFIQPDGTALKVRLIGDEKAHCYMTADGYPLINDDDVFYYAMEGVDGRVCSSGIEARDVELRSAETHRLLAGVDAPAVTDAIFKSAVKLENGGRRKMASPRNYGLFPGTDFPAKGEQKALVLLVEFSNVEFFTEDAQVYFDRMLNSDGYNIGGANGSARQYFIDNSSGVFAPEFDVYGPVMLSQSMSYYGANDDFGQDMRPHEMVIEACSLLDSEIDFSEYDRDGDGVIDNVFVFYAGKGEATGGGANSIWPHSSKISDLTTGKVYEFDNVVLSSYACTNEWVDNHTCGIGTFCHEFSHVLGLPDLYSVNYNPAVFSPGDYTLMDHGSYNNDEKTPAGYSIFERYALGWIEPQIISGSCEVRLNQISENDGAIIPAYDEGEFFLLENRQQTGWDAYIPGHGMLVWHIDYLDRIWKDNIVNDDASHQYVDLEEADAMPTEATRGGDSFPGDAGGTEINDDTTPSLRPWSGRKRKLAISDIAETSDGIVTFNVSVPGSGLTDVLETGGARVRINGTSLRVESPRPVAVMVVSASGVTLAAETTPLMSVELPSAGIYMVYVDGDVAKIAAR